ncbi:MAG: response regulator [Kangiellaceae bacterium]|nr:response regulator [Kangiellaceae bacterium]MCW8997391.1 response regulator [Kangiellaceae bacterium]
MTERAKILSIDDEPSNHEVIQNLLGGEYELAFAQDGQRGIKLVEVFSPDIVLLDVDMPQMNGLEVCKQIRQQPFGDNLPILFVSTKSSPEERVAGYQAGGDDFLFRPLDEIEVVNKLKIKLASKYKTNSLEKASSDATKAALAAINGAAELGFIITLLRESFACNTVDDLGDKVFNTLTCYDLDGSLLLRFDGKNHFYPAESESNLKQKEKQALQKAHLSGRVFEYAGIAIFSTPIVSLLIRRMPEDEERAGRLKEHLAILVEGVEARLKGLENEHRRKIEKQLLEQSIELTHGCLEELKHGHHQQRVETARILSDTAEDMEELFLRLGLDESQETQLLSLIERAEEKTDETFRESDKLQHQFEEIELHLNSLLASKVR